MADIRLIPLDHVTYYCNGRCNLISLLVLMSYCYNDNYNDLHVFFIFCFSYYILTLTSSGWYMEEFPVWGNLEKWGKMSFSSSGEVDSVTFQPCQASVCAATPQGFALKLLLLCGMVIGVFVSVRVN